MSATLVRQITAAVVGVLLLMLLVFALSARAGDTGDAPSPVPASEQGGGGGLRRFS